MRLTGEELYEQERKMRNKLYPRVNYLAIDIDDLAFSHLRFTEEELLEYNAERNRHLNAERVATVFERRMGLPYVGR